MWPDTTLECNPPLWLPRTAVTVEKVAPTGRSEPVCGREWHPLKASAFTVHCFNS
jgi:hypothetical protein